MWRDFDGTISGNGLSPTDVSGKLEEQEGKPPPPRRGRFRWQGSHTFQSGGDYRLELEGGRRFYDITITGSSPPFIEFVTR
jgi:hypothetical protein